MTNIARGIRHYTLVRFEPQHHLGLDRRLRVGRNAAYQGLIIHTRHDQRVTLAGRKRRSLQHYRIAVEVHRGAQNRRRRAAPGYRVVGQIRRAGQIHRLSKLNRHLAVPIIARRGRNRRRQVGIYETDLAQPHLQILCKTAREAVVRVYIDLDITGLHAPHRNQLRERRISPRRHIKGVSGQIRSEGRAIRAVRNIGYFNPTLAIGGFVVVPHFHRINLGNRAKIKRHKRRAHELIRTRERGIDGVGRQPHRAAGNGRQDVASQPRAVDQIGLVAVVRVACCYAIPFRRRGGNGHAGDDAGVQGRAKR